MADLTTDAVTAPTPDAPDDPAKREAALQLQQSLNPLPMTDDELSEWRREIEASRKRIKAHDTAWDILLKEYMPIVTASGTPEQTKGNDHFTDVHTKIGQLFVKSPEVYLTPKGPALDQIVNPQTGQVMSAEDVIAVKQAVLNERLGRDGINVARLMDECLLDILIWAGICAVKVGYRATMQTIQSPVMVPDPSQPPMPGQPPPMMPDPSGATQPQQVPIFEEWYADKIDAKKILFNADLHSTRFEEKATWIGQDFAWKKSRVMKEFGLLDDDLKTGEDDRLYKHDEDTEGGSERVTDLIRGVELFYKAAVYTDTLHPQAINHLVMIDGITDRTVVHRPSPDQTFDQLGKLTDDSLVGFPIKIGTIRDVPDSPFPPSDCAFTNNLVKQENTYIRQSVKLRDAQIGKMLFDVDVLDDEKDEDDLKYGEVGTMIAVKSGALAAGADKVMAATPRVTGTVDDARGLALIQRKRQETLGLGGPQLGTPEATVRSATEVATMSTAVAGRNNKEQGRFIDLFLAVVRAIDTLIVRYTSGTDYIQIAGEDGARKIMFWNKKVLQGKYSYDIHTDSQLVSDAARDRQQAMAFYNISAKDPLVNRQVILRDLARSFGFDPTKLILTQLPAQMMQPPHGGNAQPGEAVNQHQSAQTGQRENAPGAAQANDNRNGRNMTPGPAQPNVPQAPGIPGGPIRPQ